MPFTLVSGSFCLHFSGSTLIFYCRTYHLPTKRRVVTVVANFNEELKVFKCIIPLCEIPSKKRFTVVRHFLLLLLFLLFIKRLGFAKSCLQFFLIKL